MASRIQAPGLAVLLSKFVGEGTHFSHFFWLRAAMMTVAFFWDRHLATSKPMPEELPVISSDLSHSS